jgi:hypothetical protein
MKINHISILLTSLLFIFLLNFYKLLDFSPWPQVEDLHLSNARLVDLFEHPHFYRYIISMPGLIARDYFFEIGFSLYISLFMLFSILLMYFKIKYKHMFVIALACSTIFIGHLFMNGRGAISWLGWMIVLYIVSENKNMIGIKKTLFIIFALLCCSVSSGTFTVSFFVILTFFLKEFFYNKNLRAIIAFFLVYILYIDLALEGIERNLRYYSLGTGNPILNMIDHGFGELAKQNSIQISLFLSLLFISATFFIFSMKSKIKFWEGVCLIYPLAGGVFGYTTLTLMIPSIILILSSRFSADLPSQDGQRILGR